MNDLSLVVLVPSHVDPHDLVVPEHAQANRALGVLRLELGDLLGSDVVVGLDQVLVQRLELGERAPALEAGGGALPFSGLVTLHVSPVHVLGHEVASASGHLAGVPGFHLDLDRLKSGLAVGVVNVVAVSAQVEELPHADCALVADDLGEVVPELVPHVGAVNPVVNGPLVRGVSVVRGHVLGGADALVVTLVVGDGADAERVLVGVHRVVAHDPLGGVALKGVLVKLLLPGEGLRAAVALEDAVGGDVVAVVFEVGLDLDRFHEELAASANLKERMTVRYFR